MPVSSAAKAPRRMARPFSDAQPMVLGGPMPMRARRLEGALGAEAFVDDRGPSVDHVPPALAQAMVL